jgi:hypothetical protein
VPPAHGSGHEAYSEWRKAQWFDHRSSTTAIALRRAVESDQTRDQGADQDAQ